MTKITIVTLDYKEVSAEELIKWLKLGDISDPLPFRSIVEFTGPDGLPYIGAITGTKLQGKQWIYTAYTQKPTGYDAHTFSEAEILNKVYIPS